MVEHTANLDDIFKALADPTRRAILSALKTSDRTVGELAAPHAMSLAGASKHIGVLEQAGLLQRTQKGREIHCRLRADTLQAAEAWLQSYADLWTTRLDRLDEWLQAEQNDD